MKNDWFDFFAMLGLILVVILIAKVVFWLLGS